MAAIGTATRSRRAGRPALDAESDRQLVARIQERGGLAEIALRIDLAGKLKPGHYVTRCLHDDLVATTRDARYNTSLTYDEWKYLAERLVIADRRKGETPRQISGTRNAAAYARFALGAIDWDGDPIDDCDRRQWHVCRLLLWPQSKVISVPGKLAKDGEWPELLPWVETVVLDGYAEKAGASIRNTWIAARKPGPARCWLEEFVRSHQTQRQRQGLCSELGVSYSPHDKLPDLEDAIVENHRDRSLKLPAVLDGKRKGRKA